MKKLLAILLTAIMLLSLAACGDNNTTDPDNDNPGVSQSGENNNQSKGSKLIAAEANVEEGSESYTRYYAVSFHEEYTFDKDGTLTDYKKIYTLRDDADTEAALDYATNGQGYTASIVDGKLVIDGNGRYSGVKYADWDMERVKSVLDKRGTTYTVE